MRVSGPSAHDVAASVFMPRKAKDSTSFAGYTVHYGRFRDPDTGESIDDGLLTVFRAPHSYTGEESVELSCHGGSATTQRLLRATLAAGARLAEPGEFTQRAFLNGRLDLAQAEAVADLIRARTDAAQRIARRQLDGALSQAVRALRDELIGILAAIEVTIDFSDEVGELDHCAVHGRIRAVRHRVDQLLATAERGRILREGLHVALIGRPNVGKSSLFNALLRENRAIVTELPGTTRDRIEETANIGGVPLVLVDVAGIRQTTDLVESVGVERAQAALTESDLILFVLDAGDGITEDDHEVAARLQPIEHGRILTVLNKNDIVSEWQSAELTASVRTQFARPEVIAVSALTGEGIADLERCLLKIVLGGESAPSVESVIVSSARHQEALEAGYESLIEAERTAEMRLPGDFIAIDARGALDSLGRITGETVTDDVIHRIFRDFCVGK